MAVAGENLPAIEVSNLRRVYTMRRREPLIALDDLSLKIGDNEIHGLLGPNGAGKTTLVKILSTVLLPTSGTARVLGHDVVRQAERVRAAVGVVFGGERGLYDRVDARRNLAFFGAMYQLDARTARRRADALLERVGLLDRADEPVERFSRGMKQRLHLARGLLHEPRVVFLDESTAGLDPVAANDFRQLIRELRDEGRTVLLATHDMDEAAELCDRVSLIDRGKLLLTGAVTDIGQFIGTRECVDFPATDGVLTKELGDLPSVVSLEQLEGAGQWRAYAADREGIKEILRWLHDREVLSARLSEPTLEEVYLRVVGNRGMRV